MSDRIDPEEAIFQAAIELETPSARAEYVRKACGTDRALLDGVMSLLESHEHAGGFLDAPPASVRASVEVTGKGTVRLADAAQTCALTEKPGDRIGRYKLLQKIGEGGCGVVYMAEQEEPVHRRVALKIIKVGMDTRQVIARFEAERQALAMMDHPNIAKVLEAGATETGRPFFVMDLVRGIKITDYCDQNKLATGERLELFQQVCHAIQHAHQKGIIHRDIKPSNILVTLHDGLPVPVIIDFGIAKATEQRLTEKTLFTAFEQFIGTPAYMSPEQAEMSQLDIDTRSDIYSLGVLLYELLTGKTPFDPQTLLQAGLDEMRRTIREKEPVRPSTRLSTMLEVDLSSVARDRDAEPLRLVHLLRGDLDWIVMKCLEKDRTRRYETANGLALDVRRHLHNEPVLARPPSAFYRFQKMVRRNRVAVAAASAVSLALIVGLAVSMRLFVLERNAYQRAALAERSQRSLRQEAEKARLSEAEQRRSSEQNARQSRLNSYAADVYSAFLAWQSENLGRAMDLLERQIPGPGLEDLRGFEWRYLWQQARGDELVSLPHEGLVSCAQVSANGQYLVSASYDSLVRIWDVAEKRVVKSFPGFNQQFGWRYVAYSADGKWLAGLRQGKLTIWDCALPDYPIRFEEPTDARVIEFARDGRHLIGWGDSGLVLLDTDTWQTATIRTKLKPGSFSSLAIDFDGKLAAVAQESEFAVEIWDLESRMLARFFTLPNESGKAFVSLAWSPSGLLAGTTWSGRLLLLDARAGNVVASAQAHTGSAFGLAFAPNAEMLVTAGHDQLIHFWSVPGLQRLATLHGHRDEIWSLAFSKDGRLLCTAGKDGTAKIWSPTPKPPPLYVTNWFVGEFSADGKAFVTLSDPTTELSVDYWDVDNPGVRTAKTLPVGDVTNLARFVLSGDAKLLAVGKRDGTAEVWNLETDRNLANGRLHNCRLSSMAFSENARSLALGTEDGTVDLWNWQMGQITPFGTRQAGRITRINFLAGDFLAVGVQGRPSDLVWDLKTGAERSIPVAPMDSYLISPDGRTLAGASSNYCVKLWDLPGLQERAMLRGHRWSVSSMAFSQDGKLIATGSLDAVARLWDVATGRELTPALRGHLQGVEMLAFSPDGKALATASTDNTVKIWHVATGRELFSVTDAAQPKFSPDGNTLLLKTSHGARLLHVPTLAEIDATRNPN
jgi:WD40 repeat protein/serine/threonine protein kinase